MACFAAAACSDIQPEPNDEGGGALEAPTHEQDSLREGEQRQEEQRQAEQRQAEQRQAEHR